MFEWLWITGCFGCGNSRIWDVVNKFSTVTEVYEALRIPEKGRELLSGAEYKSAGNVTEEQVDELISYCENKNIYILTFDDEKYPERLRSIYNPPAALFCRGDLKCLENDFSLSVVGTRKPSDYSVKLTSALVRELARFGINIISGFAVGIDITANLSAVRNGGKTIAVLGCGLDCDYPKQNIRYRDEICKNGLFISEYYPKMSGTSYSFPARNRILSGLSLGTVVIEADAKSGALITANLALSQGRDIFVAAPHNLFDKRYGGNVSLIRDGAVCLCGVKDIIYEYYENYGHKIANAASQMLVKLRGEDFNGSGGAAYEADSDKTEISEPSGIIAETNSDEVTGGVTAREKFDASSLSESENKVYTALKTAGKPMLVDEIAEACGIDVSDILTLLTDLELAGAVRSSAGQSYTAN